MGRKKRREKPIFQTIFTSLMLVLLAEVLMLMGCVLGMGITRQLNENAEDMLAMQVRNRTRYLQDILQDAQDLSELSEHINAATERLLADGTITRDSLDDNVTSSGPLLEAIAPELVSTLRAKNVTGIFVILNTQDLNTRPVNTRLQAVYLRDLDPDARPSERNADLFIERGSSALVKKLGITTDKSWEPSMAYVGNKGGGLFRLVYQAAYQDDVKLSAEDYGRWTTESYKLVGDDRSAIAYSQPLILDDGTVYGVLGVEILTSYLEEKLPAGELNDSDSAYFLASTTSSMQDERVPLQRALTTGSDAAATQTPGGMLVYQSDDNGKGGWIELDKQRYYAVAEPLSFYNRNAPFSHEQWQLVGIVKESTLFAFSSNVRRVLLTTVLLTFLLSVVGGVMVARGLARPTERLYKQVVQAQNDHVFPKLSSTGVRELDRFADAITDLNRELVNNSTKFLRIMDMASVELGGYELRFDTGSVYATDNFFALLGAPEVDGNALTVREFEEKLYHLRDTRTWRVMDDGDCLFRVQQGDKTRYIRLTITVEPNTQVGLAEDMTVATQERLRVEHERDYDILTGIYNRQAFHRITQELFANRRQIGNCAALLMMDLDNLKHVNDTYGHDWGDQYIRQTGQCILNTMPEGNAFYARLSGDEFVILYYGYRSQEEVRAEIDKLRAAMRQSCARLPDGSELHISISGGIAWYPEDGTDLSALKKYADFALYQVKRSTKGRLEEFDIGAYNQEQYAAQVRREFQQLVAESNVYYVFQPIYDAATGRVMSYEALMRSNLPTLRSPATIMKTAREQGALYEIEKLTFSKALESFEALHRKGLVRGDAMLFINSIASVCLTKEDSLAMDARFHDLRRRMVMEITEEEEMDKAALEIKRNAPGFSGIFALDDYGSGYSNENSLLELAPRFIKVDISIIRNVDKDPDKQQIMRNIVAYAHPRSMKIIAEGVETADEMRKVIELGADALQGYFLARPASVPARIAPAAMQVIEETGRNKKD